MSAVLRFAPSPNGRLHVGHAYSALLNAGLAQAFDGHLLVRIEDIDPVRCTPAFEVAILEDLAWLGLAWAIPVRRQSEHLSDYESALMLLRRRGLIYPCSCTRGDIRRAVAVGPSPWPRDPDGAPLYPGTCKALSRAERARRLSEREPAAFRLDTAAALGRLAAPLDWLELGTSASPDRVSADAARWGDALIARKDVPTSYHLAVITDDAAQGVTHVVRGRDLYAATGLHRLLQGLLGLPAPYYHHHRLILDDTGQKLSKSRQAPSLRSLRLAGATPASLRLSLGFG